MNLSEKNKQALIAGLVLAVLLGGLLVYFFVMFVRPQLEKNKAERVKLNASIQTLDSELDRFNKLLNDKTELERLNAVVVAARKRMPASEQSIEFLTLLRDSLTKTGVAQNRVAPEKVQTRTGYKEIPYSVRGAARFHEFGQFVNLIECHPDRMMRVSSFSLSNNDKRPSVHPMDVGITTFMFTDAAPSIK